MTRIIGTQKYRQTAAGIWRKDDAYGNFFLQTSKRPDYIVNSMWKEMQRQNRLTEMRGLEAMNKIVQASLDKLPSMADAQLIRDLKTEKAKVDNVATNKKKRLKQLKALETARMKAQKRESKAPDDIDASGEESHIFTGEDEAPVTDAPSPSQQTLVTNCR